jgi:hypothetical protein
VIASSAFTPYAGLDYGDAISFQFHPEFSRAFAAALIKAKRERYPDLVASAVQSHSQPDDCDRVGCWIDRFLESDAAAPSRRQEGVRARAESKLALGGRDRALARRSVLFDADMLARATDRPEFARVA